VSRWVRPADSYNLTVDHNDVILLAYKREDLLHMFRRKSNVPAHWEVCVWIIRGDLILRYHFEKISSGSRRVTVYVLIRLTIVSHFDLRISLGYHSLCIRSFL
jgi:hypothetical protein